ncbi:MAG: alpha/beta hydrolase [Candidatus Latescibacteria bacterium]|nr:alpha/beta hydrolase [Candidatus Latescibacterota bacterium]
MPRVSIHGVALNYLTKGDGPQNVVFIHGFCQSSVFWKEALTRLPAGHRGFALDLKGFGDSDKPPGPYGIPIFADEILAFADAMGLDRFVLVGNSMGGVVCQSFATRYAHRLSKLVLVSTGAYARNPAGAQERAEKFLTMAWDRSYFEESVKGFFAIRPENWEDLVDVAMKPCREALAQTGLSSASLNFLEALRQVRVPTLIVQGERDTSRTPEDGKEIQEAIPGSVLHVLAGAGHTPQLERPDLFYPLFLDFLAA